MKPVDIESRLTELGENWPIASVSQSVVQRIKSDAVQPVTHTHAISRRLTMIGSLAAMLMLAAFLSLAVFGSASTLHAEVQGAIRKSKAVHLVISNFAKGLAGSQAEIWYADGIGFRAESPDKILVDNRTTQWSWKSGSSNIVTKRASQDGMKMIGEMLQLESVSPEWKQARATELDRDIDGQACTAYVMNAEFRSGLTETRQHRVTFWRDSLQRVVNIDYQESADGTSWQNARTIAIAYDQEIDSQKFGFHAPEDAKIVDADRVWEDRYPLAKALVTTEKDGIEFAVHDVKRCGSDMFYVVSSVRGTPEYLKAHPAKARRLNLETTILDVAQQLTGPSVQQIHIATISTANLNGVHYMWWIAADRQFFQMKDGVKERQNAGTRLEVEPGKLQLPLMANVMNDTPVRLASTYVNVQLSDSVLSMAEIAKDARQELSLSSEVCPIYMFEGDSVRVTPATEVTDDQVAESLNKQLEWLRSHDELSGTSLGGLPQ